MRYLDKHSDSSLPAAHVVVESESEFLDRADASDVVVRGEKLCAWAELFWQGRGWDYQILQSPIQKLRAYSPEMGAAEARQLLTEIAGSERVILNARNIGEILDGLFPSDVWRGNPSLRHAASWLLWLEERTLPVFVHPLLKRQAALWLRQIEGPETQLYAATQNVEAQMLLDDWLGITEKPGISTNLPEFPLDVPEHLRDRIEKSWRFRTVERRGLYFREIVARQFSRELKENAVKISSDYFKHHPTDLDTSIIQELAEFLPAEDIRALRDIVPPPEPTMPPESFVSVVDWFNNDYLPYRLWAVGREEKAVQAHCQKLGTAFAMWFLGFYPSALASGDEAICFRRSGRKMHDRSEKVTLMIILDGIGIWDARELNRLLRNEQKRLKLTRNGWCFAALPTVTAICKPAMRQGVPPRNVNPSNYALAHDSVRLLEHENAAEVLKDAKVEDFYIWSIIQTDKTYHQQADFQTIQDNIRGVLSTIAKRISAAVQSVPNGLKLHVMITTDHGRLLGRSKRTIPLPSGMQSHQRAAWGSSSIANPCTDFEIVAGGKAARLHPERFGLAQPALVAIDEDSFVNNDGSGGVDAFPHGGVWPEEVIIPWLEFQRDVDPPHVEGRVSGSAVEGRDGQIEVCLTNASPLEMEVCSLSIIGGDKPYELTLNQILPAKDARIIACNLSPWPSANRIMALTANCVLRQPTGECMTIPLAVNFQSESFQKRRELLDDLL